MKTQTFKSMRGWQSVTVIQAPEIGSKRIIEILTMKRSSGKLVTTAQVQTIEAGMFLYRPFSDFNEFLEVTASRATEKSVATQQAKALETLPQVIERAVAYYKAKQAA